MKLNRFHAKFVYLSLEISFCAQKDKNSFTFSEFPNWNRFMELTSTTLTKFLTICNLICKGILVSDAAVLVLTLGGNCLSDDASSFKSFITSSIIGGNASDTVGCGDGVNFAMSLEDGCDDAPSVFVFVMLIR